MKESRTRLKTSNNTYIRRVNSFCIELYKPLLGNLMLKQQDADTILIELPKLMRSSFQEKEEKIIELSVGGAPIKIRQRTFGTQIIYGVTFTCSDLWWFSEEELKDFLKVLSQVAKN